MSDLWRIEELQAIAEQALAATLPEADLSGRVRAVPDARTIRYYTTIGLLDRATEMRGRTAYYGRRHVLQLVAIKQLQATGMSLEQVQQKLAGVTTRKLTDIAGLPHNFWDRPLLAKTIAPRTAAAPIADRANFWAAAVAPASELPVVSEAQTVMRLPLAPGVSLELAGGAANQLTADNAAALRPALEQLAQELKRLGITS
ncbi:helix-turn-helix domain-containing protein [Anatilimnocola floriformis]|uniref:helix-turn-helix domain-containing protein n=1 Tax=Anatilimnocola floriformis TaxID=2948575 RepID=UPI0020C58791|nr:helix-turn-helix domain-containing protein [Anatilimnocola floriformis]